MMKYFASNFNFPLFRSHSFHNNVNEFERTAISLLFISVFIGIILFQVNFSAYLEYLSEDNIIEWLTVITLFACFDVSLKRSFRLFRQRKTRFILSLLLFSLLFLFGAGEEISWGQRIFSIESTDFFLKFNSQNETNIHNLVFNNIRINKAVFSSLIGIVIFFYMIPLPILYKRNVKIKKFIDSFAVPVPQNYHIISYLILAVLINVFLGPDKWELLEMSGSAMFFLIILNPVNGSIFAQHTERAIIKDLAGSRLLNLCKH